MFRKGLNIINASNHVVSGLNSSRQDSNVGGELETEKGHPGYFFKPEQQRNIESKTETRSKVPDGMKRENNPNLRQKHSGFGSRANYSIPNNDNFYRTFNIKYAKSYFYTGDKSVKYGDFLKLLTSHRKKGSRLKAFINNRG